jgi:hypothetical protein
VEDLVKWLGAQLDEDELEAERGYLKADPLPDYDGWDKSTTAGLPPAVAARVLREIDAKRQILDEHELVPTAPGKEPGCAVCVATPSWGPEVVSGPCTTLRLLALPYADRPGYREEWRP